MRARMVVNEIHYGIDLSILYLRIDFVRDGAAVERKACYVQRRQLRGTWKQLGAGAAA